MSATRFALIAALVGIVVGAVAGATLCWIALDHNPQGEFADYATGAYTTALYRLFASATLMVAVPLTATAWLVGALAYRLARRRD